MEPLSISSIEITESPIELAKKLSLIGKDHDDESKLKLSYDNLSTLELKELLLNKQNTKKLEPSEYLYISKLVKEKTTKEIESKFENLTKVKTDTKVEDLPPPGIALSRRLFPSKLVTAVDESLNSIPSLSIEDHIGLSISVNQNNEITISRKKSDIENYDWIALYNYETTVQSNYLKYWWASNEELTFETGFQRDHNRTYYVKYWRSDSNGNYKEIAKTKKAGTASCSVKGSLGEKITITWSNSDTSSNNSYCSLHNSPINKPSNPNNYISKQYQWAHKDNGSYTTDETNNGLSYYAVLWGATDDGYTILATSDILGPANRNLSIVESYSEYYTTNQHWAETNTEYLAIRWSNRQYFDPYDHVTIKKGSAPEKAEDYSYYNWAGANSGGSIRTDQIFDGDEYYASYCSWSHEDEKYVIIQTVQLSKYTKWMTDNWDSIKDRKINQLVLPGSHDAGTYAITDSSKLSLDYGGGSPRNELVASWSVTQSRPIADQLTWGTRYFDIRVAPHPDYYVDILWVYHNFFSIPVSQVLKQIAEFSAKYPKEIIILHFSHLYYLNEGQHVKFIAEIKESLGNKLSNRSLGNDVKCSQLEDKSIICIYDDRIEDKAAGKIVPNKIDHILNEPLFWYNSSLVSNYDENKYHDIKDVISFLDNESTEDHSGVFWVLQCILTIDQSFTNVGQLAFSNLYSWTLSEINKFMEFLNDLDTYNFETNIIMTDFVSYYPLTQYAIRRNLKTLPSKN